MAAAVVQSVENSGTNVASLAATWGSTTTAGNLLRAYVVASGNAAGSPTVSPPSGWSTAISRIGTGTRKDPSVYIFYIENCGARSGAEIFTPSVSVDMTLRIEEMSGFATASVLDKTASNFSVTATTPADSGTTAATTQAGEQSVAVLANSQSSTQSSQTNGYALVSHIGPTANATAANTYARAENYDAITHPSLPNYLDLFAGSDYGITRNCNPSASCHIDARNLADNLEAAGLSWKGYFESMDTPCKVTDGGGYIAHHNPFIYFDDIRTNATRCASHVVNYAVLAADLASTATSPNYALIVPNNCNNTHDCSIATGDAWLAAQLPLILASPACTVERCLLVLTWDEDDGSQGNHVLTVFAGSAARTGSVSATRYDHFSLLRTVEDVFDLPTQTANDAAASPMLDLLR